MRYLSEEKWESLNDLDVDLVGDVMVRRASCLFQLMSGDTAVAPDAAQPQWKLNRPKRLSELQSLDEKLRTGEESSRK